MYTIDKKDKNFYDKYGYLLVKNFFMEYNFHKRNQFNITKIKL